MKKIKKFVLIVIFGFFLFSCGNITPTPIEPSEESDLIQDDYNDFFKHSNKVQIELDFSNNSIQKFAEYGVSSFDKSEQYHPCHAVIKINNEIRFDDDEVGARMKGNTSLNANFIDKNSFFVKDEFCHFKLSFSETFDDKEDNDYYSHAWAEKDLRKIRKNRRFGDMKKIDLKYNKEKDNTFTKEAYAFNMYKEEGLVSLNCNLVELTIKTENDTRVATYMAYETIDKQMLKKHLNEDEVDGDLYKLKWGATMTKESLVNNVGEESKNFSPRYEIKTNEDTTDHHLLYNAVNLLNQKGSSEDIKQSIEETFNVDYLLKLFALQWIAGDPDDWRMNSNNTSIYFNSKDNKMIVIPYDQDRCFGILHEWPINTSFSKCTETKMLGSNNEWQKNILFWRLIINEDSKETKYSDDYPVISEFQEKYQNYCKEYAKKYLDYKLFEEFTNDFYYAPSKGIFVGGSDNLSFYNYANNKLNNII